MKRFLYTVATFYLLFLVLHAEAQLITTDTKLVEVIDADGSVYITLEQLTGNAIPNKLDTVKVFVWSDRWYKLANGTVLPDDQGRLRLLLVEALDDDYVQFMEEKNIRLGMIQYLQGLKWVQLRW